MPSYAGACTICQSCTQRAVVIMAAALASFCRFRVAAKRVLFCRSMVSKSDGIPVLSAAELAAEAAAMDAEMEALFGSEAADDFSSLHSARQDEEALPRSPVGQALTSQYTQKLEAHSIGSNHSPSSSSSAPVTHLAADSGQHQTAGNTCPAKQNEAAADQSAPSPPQPIINITYNIHHHHYYQHSGNSGSQSR